MEKEITNWPGYTVTDDGRVLSYYGRGWKGGELRTVPVERKTRPNHRGEPIVTLHIGNQQRTAKVSVLVATAFHGPKPEGKECSHLDGNATNNRAGNLCWETSKENNARKREHRTMNYGERNGMSTLTALQVEAIREIAGRGIPQTLIARALRITDGHVSDIVNFKRRQEA